MKKQSVFFIVLLSVLFAFMGCATTGGSGAATVVTVEGNQLMVNGEPFQIKGVCWNPIGKGGNHPHDLDFLGFVEQDATLMAAAGINTIRTYEPISDTAVLDVLYEKGIYVINAALVNGAQTNADILEIVKKTKNHPAILMWSLGNEWNYNKLYSSLSTIEVMDRIVEVTEIIKSKDVNHPVATIYGVWGADLPAEEMVEYLEGIDIWGINMYAGLGFETLFETWESRYDQPIFMAEYGADAWNADEYEEDVDAQAFAVATLTNLLLENSSAADPSKIVLGGTVFEWADEWWKDGQGSPNAQDRGGAAPGGGPHPDGVFNEEYWGIVDIDRNPRPAYEELKKIYLPAAE